MDAQNIISLFGLSAKRREIETLFSSLKTLNRPSLPDDEEDVYADWVLVRRLGIELGFCDSENFKAGNRALWGHGDLLLTQAYFYSGFDDVQPYTGKLPHGLLFSDHRNKVRTKLVAYESTRHSYLTDTWDVVGYRLNIVYKNKGLGIDRICCFLMETPIPSPKKTIIPKLSDLVDAFGADVQTREFRSLFGGLLDENKLEESISDNEIDFVEDSGLSLTLARSGDSALFRSIVLYCNRHRESAGWKGDLPQGLNFEDSPDILFSKIKETPIQQSDCPYSGHAVWQFNNYTLHVLYSNLYNRIMQVTLISPGVWKP